MAIPQGVPLGGTPGGYPSQRDPGTPWWGVPLSLCSIMEAFGCFRGCLLLSSFREILLAAVVVNYTLYLLCFLHARRFLSVLNSPSISDTNLTQERNSFILNYKLCSDLRLFSSRYLRQFWGTVPTMMKVLSMYSFGKPLFSSKHCSWAYSCTQNMPTLAYEMKQRSIKKLDIAV